MKAHVHYEAAFENFLRTRAVPYVSVDEARRAAFRDAHLKSFDFIAYSSRTTNWLIDVKGRRFVERRPGAAADWQNWVTQADLDGLRHWQEVFGVDFRGLFVFAYWIQSSTPPPPEIVHPFRDQQYVFAAVPLDEYASCARVRSPKWGTVNLRKADFVRFLRPMTEWL